jgi:integrative and conjugative element protein (TIGR02256 family)
VWSRTAATDVDERLSSPLSTLIGTIAPAAGCPTCREPPVSELVLDSAVNGFIISETDSCPSVETGGVLLGYIDEKRRIVVTRATGPGPKAVKTATLFRRDVEYTQAEIGRAAKELGDRGQYVGEWHSHLEPSPQPSSTDIESLCGIAAAPNYLTSHPVMLIVGYDTNGKKVAAVRSWVFVVGGRFYRIPNNHQAR